MMDSEEFKKVGEEMIDYIADYRDTIYERPVIPDEKPGFLKKHIRLKAPENAEEWKNLMKDVDEFIIPGLSHWAHPHFNAYYPTGYALVSILGTVLTGAFGCVGTKWSNSPASTELEIIVLEWLAISFDLPKKFLFYEEGSKGGGVLQGSASECTLLILLAAQKVALEKLKAENASISDGELLASLVAYCSKETHSSVEKACLIAMVTLRILDTDDKRTFRGEELEKAVEQDLEEGLHPFFVCGTMGTTGTGAVDKFDEIGPICEKYDLWLHIDGAYGIAALICPEFRHFASGFEYASSVSMNPHKWLLTHFDCSALWLDDRRRFIKALASDPSSIVDDSDTEIIDFFHWGTSNRRKFKALKVWMVMRTYGIQGLQRYIRNHVQLTQKLKLIIEQDDRFELLNVVNFGTLCFRLKNSNDDTAKLLAAIVHTRKMFLVPASLGDKYVIRWQIGYEHLTEDDILEAWDIITTTLDGLKQS